MGKGLHYYSQIAFGRKCIGINSPKKGFCKSIVIELS